MVVKEGVILSGERFSLQIYEDKKEALEYIDYVMNTAIIENSSDLGSLVSDLRVFLESRDYKPAIELSVF